MTHSGSSDAPQSPRCHLCGARRSHPPGDPGAAGARRGHGDRARRAVRDQPARHLQASQGAGERRPDLARARCAAAAVPARGATARAGDRMAGELSPVLGSELPATRHVARRVAGQTEQAEQAKTQVTGVLMSTQAQVTVTTPSDREIMMARAFDAPRSVVFDCYTKPELLKRWLHGPGGWLRSICDTDLRVGGAFRWVWRHVESG